MNKSTILPPAMLGILGGGQLGRMFTVAAKTMGYKVTVLDPDPNAPAAEFADRHLCAPFDDEAALEELAKCAAVTTEFENVNADAMRFSPNIPMFPPAATALPSRKTVFRKRHGYAKQVCKPRRIKQFAKPKTLLKKAYNFCPAS